MKILLANGAHINAVGAGKGLNVVITTDPGSLPHRRTVAHLVVLVGPIAKPHPPVG